MKTHNKATRSKSVALAVLALLLTASCADKQNDLGVVLGNSKSTLSSDPGVTLGQRLVNAYSVANMQAAYDAIHSNGNNGNTVEVANQFSLQPTHKYVRIVVHDTSELTNLLADTTIALSQYPLDYELIGTGVYTPNPDSANIIYAVVPYLWDIDSYDYELIDDCIIPDDDDEEMQEVEYKSLEMNGYLKKDEGNGNRCWGNQPSGDIKVYNTETLHAEGVRNVKMRMQILVKIRDVYTNTNGHYYTNSKFYLSNIHYTVIYTNNASSFKLWDNNFAVLPATRYLGEKPSTGYSYTMYTNSTGWRASTVNNAVDIYRQRLCNDIEMLTPPTNDLRIALMHMNSLGWGGSTPMFRHRILNDLSFNEFIGLVGASSGLALALPDMFLFSDSTKTCVQYRLLFHELSHVSHYAQVGGSYWAQFVDDIIANLGYGDSTSSWLSERVGVSEMWGYFAGGVLEQYCWDVYYNHPVDTVYYGSEHWFKPMILYTINEEIPSISAAVILDCLQPNVATFRSFRDEIKRHTHFAHYAYINYLFSELCD